MSQTRELIYESRSLKEIGRRGKFNPRLMVPRQDRRQEYNSRTEVSETMSHPVEETRCIRRELHDDLKGPEDPTLL